MAGDIGVDEQIIVLPEHPEATAMMAGSVREQGARVTHHYGPRVMIGEIPLPRTEDVRAALPGAIVTGAAAAAEGLDSIGALGLAAFNLRVSPEYQAAKAARPHDNAEWDLDPPDPPQQNGAEAPAGPAGAAQAVVGNTSLQMTSSIAVGIIIVSGPTADLQFTGEEIVKVIAEVQNGLAWHASKNPAAGISWYYDIRTVSVNVAPGGGDDKEALWRDPAMVSLGYQGNWQGVYDYINHIRAVCGTQWTYVGYFTKYPLRSPSQFAYARRGGPRVAMRYSNGNWGPDNIDRVFAHETGHIFQAPDEYETSGCDCGGEFGIYNEPNGNCRRCAPESVACIMRENAWAYCQFTRRHCGFPMVSPSKPMGAVAVNNSMPHDFVQGTDGNLWVNWWSGSAWRWKYQGTPPGVSIAESIGSTLVDRGHPYVFVKGGDGNLWINWWSGSAWAWQNQGRPPGDVRITGSMGVIAVGDSNPYAFVKGSDGNLWLNWWSGSAWSWTNQGRPSGVDVVRSAGAVTTVNGRLYVFVVGSDGNLWLNWWNGSAWAWRNLNRPSDVTLGDPLGIIQAGVEPRYVFFKGSDGNLWANWWSGTDSGWMDLSHPPGVDLGDPMGTIAVAGRHPYVFVKGSDGNLWVKWLSHLVGWSWMNQGAPAGVALASAMGAVAADAQHSYVFVSGSDGNLWVNWLRDAQWAWANLGVPSP